MKKKVEAITKKHLMDIARYMKNLCLCRAVDIIKLSSILEKGVGEFQAFPHILYFL